MPETPPDRRSQPDEQAPDELVEAVAFLRLPTNGGMPSPLETNGLAHAILERVQLQTGLRPEQSKVFSNMHSFAVRAPKAFLDALSDDKDVDKLSENALPQFPST